MLQTGSAHHVLCRMCRAHGASPHCCC